MISVDPGEPLIAWRSRWPGSSLHSSVARTVLVLADNAAAAETTNKRAGTSRRPSTRPPDLHLLRSKNHWRIRPQLGIQNAGLAELTPRYPPPHALVPLPAFPPNECLPPVTGRSS